MRTSILLRSLSSLVLFALLAGAGGCPGVGELPGPPGDAEQFFKTCGPAPAPTLPQAPITCAGPDAAGWSNDVRPEDAGPCPPPPEGDCTQVVIGRQSDTSRYINCPGYIVLNRSDWTIDLNDNFVACAAACDLGTCDPPVIIVSSRDTIPDFQEEPGRTTVTSRELCQLHNAGCTVTMADENGPGSVDCGCAAPPVPDFPRTYRGTATRTVFVEWDFLGGGSMQSTQSLDVEITLWEGGHVVEAMIGASDGVNFGGTPTTHEFKYTCPAGAPRNAGQLVSLFSITFGPDWPGTFSDNGTFSLDNRYPPTYDWLVSGSFSPNVISGNGSWPDPSSHPRGAETTIPVSDPTIGCTNTEDTLYYRVELELNGSQ